MNAGAAFLAMAAGFAYLVVAYKPRVWWVVAGLVCAGMAAATLIGG